MIAIELISDDIPPIKTSDSGQVALHIMEDYKLRELPIVNNNEFLGLISEADILDMNDPKAAVGNHHLSLDKAFVYENEHIFEVVDKIASKKLSALPVLNKDKHYLGVISLDILVEKMSHLGAVSESGGILTLEINSNDYSLAQIAQIVESNGAKILSSYLINHLESTKIDVTIKINRTDLSGIIQTFERYEYVIAGSYQAGKDDDDLLNRYNSFLNYLNM